MQLSAKEYEFLGRQTARGKYISRPVFFLSIVLALIVGIGIGSFLGEKDPSQAETRRPLDTAANKAMNRQQFEAILHFESEAKKNPQNIDAWIALGNAYYDAHEFQKAINAYNAALEINPALPDVLVDCGVAYRMTVKYDTAIAYFDKALSINPQHHNALFNKGIVLHNDMKKDPEALAIWKQLVTIAPLFTTPDGRLLSDIVKAHEPGE